MSQITLRTNPRCPQITMAINKILFWKSMLKREQGGKVGLTILFARAKKAKVDHVPYPGELTIEEITHAISKAYKSFRILKKDHHQHDMWISQLIAAQAQAWNKTKKVLWRQLRSMERIRLTANNVCCVLNKLLVHKPLLTVIAPNLANTL